MDVTSLGRRGCDARDVDANAEAAEENERERERKKGERENTLNKSAAKLVRRKSRDLFCPAGLSFLAPACPEIIGKRKP